MGWREELRPASFRGVPFEVEQDSQPAGQRTQVHEYPQRDLPQVEPLGRVTDEIKITGYVVGEDCLDQRDKLLDAINEPGSGELIHPWRGSLTVSVTACNYAHDRNKKGVVRFDLTFVQGEADPSYPVAGVDAASALNAAADDVQTSALDRFSDAIASIDLSQVRLDAVLQPISQVVAVVQDVYGTVVGVIDTAQGVIDQVLAAPMKFANAVFGVIGGVQSTFAGFYGRVQGAMSLFGLGDRLAGLLRLGSTLIPGGAVNGTFVRAVRGLVQDAVVADVVRGVAALPAKMPASPQAGAVGLDGMGVLEVAISAAPDAPVLGEILGGARVDLPVADDVLQLRDDVSDGLWGLAEQSPASHYHVIAAARTATVRHLVAVARQGVRLTRYQNPAPSPALVLAYRRYGDAARAADVVERNAVRHPGFVPPRELLVPKV